ncbi:MAG: radical SAM family heme chaperone HemW, partial [Anaerolineales bacterium]|nr:radical SAM family heme chaperone HemW [Anaerolineales bacterium]
MKVSVYLHFPFCVQRCSYCDFNTYSGLDELIPLYVQSLCKEIEFIGENLPEAYYKKIHTLYFGGGTPSLLSAEALERILVSLEQNFGFGDNIEISLEANPGTLSLEKLRAYVSLGINRISLGFQSANEHELRLLGRVHSVADVVQSVELSRSVGISNINLDLIYGLPAQTLIDWTNSLETALSLGVEHLSLYSLTVEDDTSLQEWIQMGLYPRPDTDLAADCYELARDMLSNAGYLHYEISNWAKLRDGNIAYVCQHNLQYWKNAEYFGLGAGAHGFVYGLRLANV